MLDDQAQTSFIYDSNGNLITEYKGIENRVNVSLAAMPKYLQEAFIAVEDSRFYTHNGVDLKRIVGAFVSNLTSSSTQGGSTITQQLIKNTILSNELSYKRKIQEAYLALQLETRYTKDADSGVLPEHHLPGRKLLRCAGGCPGVFRQEPGRADPAGVRHAGGHQ